MSNISRLLDAKRTVKQAIQRRAELNREIDAVRQMKITAINDADVMQRAAVNELFNSAEFEPVFHHAKLQPAPNYWGRVGKTSREQKYIEAIQEFNLAMTKLVDAKIDVLKEYKHTPENARNIEFRLNVERFM